MSAGTFPANVAALSVFDDGTGPALYAGGYFTTAGSISANNIAKWNGSAWSPLGSGISGMHSQVVVALSAFDDGTGPALYAGGDFNTAGSVSAHRIAKWNGSAWSPLGSGIDNALYHYVYALTAFDDGSGPALYAGGSFFTAGGKPSAFIAAWRLDCNDNGISDLCDLTCAAPGGFCSTVPGCGQSNDCNANGVPDECEVPPLCPGCADCDANGVPDVCQLDSDGDSHIDACDNCPLVPNPGQADCDNDGKGDACTITDCAPNDPSCNDCNANGVPDECEVPPLCPGCADCDANGVPDVCQLDSDGDSHIDACDNCPLVPNPGQADCDNDGKGDACTITDCAPNDPSCNDCNGNGVPDECDIATGTSQDCNANGIPDGCDITSGHSQDCNADGRPDECGVVDACEITRLAASDAAWEDHFGQSVSISGNVAVVGVFLDDCAAGPDCGSAYVYRRNGRTWIQEQKLIASDAGQNDQFGYSVSVSGNIAVVGAHIDDCAAGTDCGSAYVYRFNGSSWVEEAKLTAFDAVAFDYFGQSVSISGDVVVVSAVFDDCAGGQPDCGAAYVYRFNGSSWVEEAKLIASDAGESDLFGASVSVSGDVVVVGAPWDNCAAGGSECGSAYVYRFNGNTWIQQSKLTASDAPADSQLGVSVSVSGDVAVVGAHVDSCSAGLWCGSAYVYRFNGSSWVEEAKLAASDAAMGDNFGQSVSVSGEVAVVGAPRSACAAGRECGSAYVYGFNGSTWIQEQKLTASDAADADVAGLSVSVSGDVAIVGAPRRNCAAGAYCGTAFVFSLHGPDCNCNGSSDVCDIADGVSFDCNANAIPDECDISSGTSQECNDNEIPDECDIATGTSQDCNSDGVPDECAPATALRDLSHPRMFYCDEWAKRVGIVIDAPGGTLAISVEDTPPPGWTDIRNISDGGWYDAIHHKVKWDPFFAPFPASVSYEVLPPTGTTGEQCFGTGTVSVDGFDETVCGDKCIGYSCCPFAPADDLRPTCDGCADCSGGCQDDRVEMSEIIGYACAWKRGCNDDISGMTRSAYLWRAGECYCWDDAADNWMSHACASPASGCCDGGGVASGAFLVASGTIDARMDAGDNVDILVRLGSLVGKPFIGAMPRVKKVVVSVTPPPGTQASAFEVQVPKGWTVLNVNDGGAWDEVHHKVKWGPLFGEGSVTMSFQVRAVRGGAGLGRFVGTASFDGVNQRFLVR